MKTPTKKTTSRAKAVAAAPTGSACVRSTVMYFIGQRWEIVRIEGGHVFAWRTDEHAPNIQYAYCLGCGSAYHHIFPPNEKASNRNHLSE